MTNAGLRVTEIKETPSAEKANALLESGWELRGVVAVGYDTVDEKNHFLYCLAKKEF